MSITNIQTSKKIEVLLRLLDRNENFTDATSKAGLDIKKVKQIIKNQY